MGDQLVRKTFGEVLLVRIAGQVFQRQDDGGGTVRCCGRTGAAERKRDRGRENNDGQADRQSDTTVPGNRTEGRHPRSGGFGWCGFGDRIQETIATTPDGLDVPRLRRGIAQRASQPVYGATDAVVEIDEGAVGPQPLPQFLTGNELAGPLDESH